MQTDMDQASQKTAKNIMGNPVSKTRRAHLMVAMLCAAAVVLMIGAAYAAVPLYSLFCRVTGFGGTPQVAEVAPGKTLDRIITVRFDANISGGLPWRFVPEVHSINVKLGEVATVYYDVINRSARATSANAGYNVTPPQSGAYFTKINCFCFTEQHLKPGEKRQMAVVFYIDPSLANDSDLSDLNTITLSYTFYPTHDEPQAGLTATTKTKASGRI